MATLTNPINAQNIVNRFADYVTATANSGILWGTDNTPKYSDGTVVVASSNFGGTTSTGRLIGITGSSIGSVGSGITASGIYNALLAETAAYTCICTLRARLNVTGAGGNNGSRPTAGIIYDLTAIAYMTATSYLQTLGSVSGAPATGASISTSGLQAYFTNLQSAYNTTRATTVTITTDVCHASCHSSCHGSRGRR